MNILYTTLSLKPKVYIENTYTAEGKYCCGVQQQEADAKYILSCCKIDKIVISGSTDTYLPGDKTGPSKLSDWNTPVTKETYPSLSTLAVFLRRMADYCFNGEKGFAEGDVMQAQTKEKDIEVVFLDEQTADGTDNIVGLIDALRGTESEISRLYMDVQGGRRTSIFVNNALLQLLSKQGEVYHAEIKKVVANDYTPGKSIHHIVDETDRYRIVDMVSGMNAFLNYGKADILIQYIGELHVSDARVEALVGAMKAIDDAISMSRYFSSEDGETEEDLSSGGMSLISAVDRLKNAILAFSDLKLWGQSAVRNIFEILLDGIRADYGSLLEGDKTDAIAIAEWCIKKNNYFPAASVIEAYFPSYCVSHGLLYYAKSREELVQAKAVFLFYKGLRNRPGFIFDDASHFFIKSYLRMCRLFFTRQNRQKNSIETSNFSGSLQALTKHPENLPVRIYSDFSEKEWALLGQYDLICQYRNALAHSNNEWNVQPGDLEKLIKEFVRDVKAIAARRIAYYLPDDALKAVPEDSNAFQQEVLYELNRSKDPFGILTYYARGDWYSNYKELYALSGLLPAMHGYATDTENMKQMTDFIAGNEVFSCMMIDYYNLQEEKKLDRTALIGYKTDSQKYDAPKTLTRIKGTLKNYDDFKRLAPYLDTEESWNAYLANRMAEFNKELVAGAMPKEAEADICDLFDYYKRRNRDGIRNMLLWAAQDEIYLNRLRSLYLENASKK